MSPKEKKSQKEQQEELVALLKRWQKLEESGIALLKSLQDQTDNPVLKEVLEIIKQDSGQHRRVQQLILDGLTKEAFSVTPEEVAAIWDKLEEHDELEKETISMAHEARKNSNQLFVRFFLGYLLADEEKHHRMLENLEDVKRGLYPYAS